MILYILYIYNIWYDMAWFDSVVICGGDLIGYGIYDHGNIICIV